MKKTPKYAQIEAELIAQIESGKLAPGAELPSESDLIECYDVSRVTVRRAIDELYHQGYVEKMQGKRACVKEKVKLQELTSVSSYTEEIIRQGMTPSRELLSSGLRVCTKEEAEQLGLKKADPVFLWSEFILRMDLHCVLQVQCCLINYSERLKPMILNKIPCTRFWRNGIISRLPRLL
ncbi:hypothetical protein HMPREF0993_02826 [Lachnospiraceae bacterium 5_1_57FAA]|nr:hypothetical protein HMPREF0993_02826 [Lachnospiraceae bacterium 5_1_57FAA]